jgi:hypothetical protein
MREAFCGTMTAAIIIHYLSLINQLIICYLMSSAAAAAACVKHPAGHAIHYYFIKYSLFYHLVSAAAACVRHPAGHAIIVDLFIDLIYYLVSAAAAWVRQLAVA